MRIRMKQQTTNTSQYLDSQKRTIGSDSIKKNKQNYFDMRQKRKKLQFLKGKALYYEYIRKFKQNANLNQQDKDQFSHIFAERLNVIYEKLSILPKKIYVCGYCKQYFNTKFSYIAHYLIQKCQLNHERSTYHFYLKDKQHFAEISDFQRCLSKKLLNSLSKSHKIQDHRFFKIKFDLLKNQKVDQILFKCGSCNYFRNFDIDLGSFVYHILYKCKCPTSQTNSHKLIRKQYIQSKSQFVQDIHNLTLNYNLLNFLKGSYLKLQINKLFLSPNQQNFNQFYCGVCNRQFQNSTKFIEHCLFVCQQKQNLVSSHIIQKIKVPEKIVQKLEIEQKSQKQQSSNQQNAQNYQKRINYTQKKVKKTQKIVIKTKPIQTDMNIDVKINKLYQNLQNKFGLQVFKCGGCEKIFQNQLDLVGHSSVYLCKINHPHSSHFIYHKNTNKMISQQECLQLLTRQQKQAFYNKHTSLFNQFYKRYKTIAKHKQRQYICGICMMRYQNLYRGRERYFYLMHIMTKCFCPYFQTNSHQLVVQNPQISLSTDDIIASMKKIIISTKISNYDPFALYIVQKNKKQQWNSNYVCGQCQLIFQDQYQLVYHSIFICDSLKNKKGSHLMVVKKRQNNDPIIKIIDFREQKSIQLINQAIEIKPNHQANIQHKRRTRITSSVFQVPQVKIDEQVVQVGYYQLYENINFDSAKANLKYYCGPCRIESNRNQTFITHLQECKNFASNQSSHFYQTKGQRYQSLSKMTIKYTAFEKLLKQDIIINEMLKLIPPQQFKCGCGKILRKDEYSSHIMHHHENIVPYQSSHIVLKLILIGCTKTVLFPVQSHIQFNTDYCCPCTPKIKRNRQQFVYHIIKRHHGKSPLFFMEPQNYKHQ